METLCICGSSEPGSHICILVVQEAGIWGSEFTCLATGEIVIDKHVDKAEFIMWEFLPLERVFLNDDSSQVSDKGAHGSLIVIRTFQIISNGNPVQTRLRKRGND